MVYCVPCPEPKILGKHITTIAHQQGEDRYFWDSNIMSVVIAKHDGGYMLVPNANILTTLRVMYSVHGRDVALIDFKLFEYDTDITKGNDDARFEECNWSDYSYDGLRVWARVSVIESLDPQM